jgi:uncharacterized protein
VTALLLIASLLVAQQGFPIPDPPRGYGTSAAEVVVDLANVLPAASQERINRIAFDVKARSGGEMAVVTLPDIGQRAVSDIALQIARQWGLGANTQVGDAARNAGVVILIVPKESNSDGRGRCWVATGRGVEGFILDADAGALCRQAIPFFQRQDYGGGAEMLTQAVAEEFAREFNFTLDSTLTPPVVVRQRERPGGLPPQLFFLGFLLLFILLSNMGGRRRGGCLPLFIPLGGFGGGYGHRSGGNWGGGGFGGGGFGGGGFGGVGGGGGFGGGGGGGSW